MRKILILLLFISFFSCKEDKIKVATPEVETETMSADSISIGVTTFKDAEVKDFREFKVLDSKYIENSELWSSFNSQLEDFSENSYNDLKSLIIEQDIPTLQKHITDGELSYELLTKFYLYRIRKFDRENELSLNAVIAINPNVIEEAKRADNARFVENSHPIFGMPILLKDNINASGMPTTAGAVALENNLANDAFIVKQLKKQGALILGKTNLSEWAYFFCGDCPSGYSAIGGQTLNPYGRRVFDTGGSSSGSGVSMAANFAVAAVGSETSGSILSPSSANSIVGLKPTIGLVSRSGIVPISSTLDTAGPMTKNVIDNAIVLDAMFGEDLSDSKSISALWLNGFYYEELPQSKSLIGKRFGAFKRLLKDSLYQNALEDLKKLGATIVEVEEGLRTLPNFISLLNLDMKNDLPKYLNTYTNPSIKVKSVSDVISFNKTDSLRVMPYGQKLFNGIVADKGDEIFLANIKDSLHIIGKTFYDVPRKSLKLHGFLSINNYHAGLAAVAEYPAITIPMGYDDNGKPKGLTFIGKRLEEKQLIEYAYAYEQATKKRKVPSNYN
ncbi:MAG: amidase [Flavobacteriaceae bacterium]|nr:amidase [Flavobacteriaceae bacterium]